MESKCKLKRYHKTLGSLCCTSPTYRQPLHCAFSMVWWYIPACVWAVHTPGYWVTRIDDAENKTGPPTSSRTSYHTEYKQRYLWRKALHNFFFNFEVVFFFEVVFIFEVIFQFKLFHFWGCHQFWGCLLFWGRLPFWCRLHFWCLLNFSCWGCLLYPLNE